jgi:hypothetical protein
MVCIEFPTFFVALQTFAKTLQITDNDSPQATPTPTIWKTLSTRWAIKSQLA